MDTEYKKTWVFMGITLAGAVGGGWFAPRMGATFGLSLGLWGVAAGAAIGTLLGAALGSVLMGEVEFPGVDERRDQPASTSRL